MLLVQWVQLFWLTQCPNIMCNPDICSELPIFSELMLVKVSFFNKEFLDAANPLDHIGSWANALITYTRFLSLVIPPLLKVHRNLHSD